MKDIPHKKHILKTITYRIFGTLVTIGIAYCFGLSLKLSSLIGLGDLLLKPIIYFAHETIWFKINDLDKNK